ncbi:hypothetical protein Salat_2517300 [Sesamum alatum]|uniref:Uncharacterized protein n=1 Tax=Sesamum alatum TaxID=300844 RepID=A0AAE1XRV1_9LAMI|nr:hypothetical protein Salat_2517300 [Sesamum alatum]
MLGTHLNHQLAEVLHGMSLQCSYWRYDRDDFQSWIQSIEDANENLKIKVDEAKSRYSEAKDRIKQFEGEKACAEKRASEVLRANEALKSEQARLGGVRAFMQSRSFEATVVKRSTNEGFISFYKCLSQLKLLKALKEDFDPHSISFFKDAKLKDYPREVVVDSVPEDEFAGKGRVFQRHDC